MGKDSQINLVGKIQQKSTENQEKINFENILEANVVIITAIQKI